MGLRFRVSLNPKPNTTPLTLACAAGLDSGSGSPSMLLPQLAAALAFRLDKVPHSNGPHAASCSACHVRLSGLGLIGFALLVLGLQLSWWV